MAPDRAGDTVDRGRRQPQEADARRERLRARQRPRPYHTRSAASAAATALPRTAAKLGWPPRASAPTATSHGATGTGAPA